MQTIPSKDGTTIAYEQFGQGPALILVVGAFNDRWTGAPLAQALASHFTVYTYDRRGRGDSGDTLPYSVEREIEDLDALIGVAGGSAAVFGFSSGAGLCILASAHGLPITSIALYEPPFMVDDTRPPLPPNFAGQIDMLVKAGRRGDAVELFQTKAILIPSEIVAQIKNAPFWPGLEATAHTLVYEMTIMDGLTLPTQALAAIPVPTLAMVGGSSPVWMQHGVEAAADAVRGGQFRVLDGQTHDLVPEVLEPVLTPFYLSAVASQPNDRGA